MEAFHRRVRLVVENWYLQRTPQGDFLVIYLEGEITGAFKSFAESHNPFDDWLKKVWLETEGVDYGQPLPGVPELGLDWQAD